METLGKFRAPSCCSGYRISRDMTKAVAAAIWFWRPGPNELWKKESVSESTTRDVIETTRPFRAPSCTEPDHEDNLGSTRRWRVGFGCQPKHLCSGGWIGRKSEILVLTSAGTVTIRGHEQSRETCHQDSQREIRQEFSIQ